VVSAPLKNMKVNWDYDIPNIWKNESHVPNHQPDILLFQLLTIINHRLTLTTNQQRMHTGYLRPTKPASLPLEPHGFSL
jgi:hypothetical protein